MIKNNISKQSKSEVTILITVDKDFISPYYKSVMKKLKKDVKIDGFRPGMAPDNLVERSLGEGRVQSEVLEEVIMHAYTHAVRELKIDTIASPKINVKKFVPYNDLEFEAVAAVMPKVSIDLKKLTVKKDAVKVSQKEINETLNNLLKQSSTKKESKTGIKNGDEVNFDFEGVRKGKPVEGASATGHILVVGEGSFIPGFEENMLGLKKSESKTFTVTFPKDYHAKDLAGQDVDFTVKINEINTIELPKATDAWAKTVGPVKDLKELKQEIENSLKQNMQSQADKEFENKVLEKAVTLSSFDAPKSLVDEQIARLKSETEQNLQNSGLDLEKYLQLQGQKLEEFEATITKEAEKRVKLGLILRHIVETDKLKVSDAELEAQLALMKSQYTDPKMQEELTHEHFREDLLNHLLTNKAVKILVEAASNNK